MEQVRYLKEDYIGLASRVKYGSKGDKVKFISQSSNMVLVENDSEKFYVREEMLSVEPIGKDDKPGNEVKQTVIKQISKPVHKKKQVVVQDNQQKLF